MKLSVGSRRKIIQSTFSRKCIVKKTLNTFGQLNGATAQFSEVRPAAGLEKEFYFSNNFEFQILKQLSDPDGRYIFCDIKAEDKIWTLLNVYAPNQDEPTFFEQIQDLLASFECEQIIFWRRF